MIKLKATIVTEGRYDKARLANIFDATVIETGGFSIYKNSEKRELLKRLAMGDGIIILTDPDKAGFRIRNYIRNFCNDGKIWDVFIPDIQGKERRKRTASKEGLLGVEGVSDDIIIEAFNRAGVESEEGVQPYKKAYLAELGLCGGTDSASLRKALASRLGLPGNMNANLLAQVLPKIVSRSELEVLVREVKNER